MEELSVQSSSNPTATANEAVKSSVAAKRSFPLIKILFVLVLILLMAALTGNYLQYQQTQKLQDQNRLLSNNLQSTKTNLNSAKISLTKLNAEAKKYLYLNGRTCNEDSETCLHTLITGMQNSPVLASASGGLCIIRDGSTNMPSTSDPDVGQGYAKVTMIGVFSIDNLKKSCSQADYTKLMQSYCLQNTKPVDFEVASVNTFGGVVSSSCSSFGCGYVSCPRK